MRLINDLLNEIGFPDHDDAKFDDYAMLTGIVLFIMVIVAFAIALIIMSGGKALIPLAVVVGTYCGLREIRKRN